LAEILPVCSNYAKNYASIIYKGLAARRLLARYGQRTQRGSPHARTNEIHRDKTTGRDTRKLQRSGGSYKELKMLGILLPFLANFDLHPPFSTSKSKTGESKNSTGVSIPQEGPYARRPFNNTNIFQTLL